MHLKPQSGQCRAWNVNVCICATMSLCIWLPRRFDTFGKFPFAAENDIPVKCFKPVRKIKAEHEYRWVGIDRYKRIISLPF